MTNPRVFKRSPRIYPDLPNCERIVEILPPPALPQQPTIRPIQLMMSVALPALFALISVLVLLNDANRTNIGMSVVSTLFMLTTSLATVVEYQLQKRENGKKRREQEKLYEAHLQERGRELENIATQQRIGYSTLDPNPQECLERVRRLDARLWERDRHDPDCLVVRIGVGKRPLCASLKAPQALPEASELLSKAEKLATRFAEIANLPICLPLVELGAIGIVGRGGEKTELARLLALQIATHHLPEDVRLVALYPKNESERWEWMKNLPHVRVHENDENNDLFMANEVSAASRLLNIVYERLKQWQALTANDRLGQSPLNPPMRYVLLLADPKLYAKDPVFSFILQHGPVLGALPILLVNHKENLPRECRGFVEFQQGKGRVIYTLHPAAPVEFTLDSAALVEAQHFANEMATIQYDPGAGIAGIPARITLLELYQAQKVEEINIYQRWLANKPFEEHSLKIPAGMKAGAEVFYLNLHDFTEPSKIGHGAHMLFAGTTGSGKSEALQTVTVSAAANFHPYWLSFFLIDYKGGGMANVFEGLPHLRGKITNLLDGSLAHRAFVALDSEVKLRQRLFAEADVTYIDDYHKKFAASLNNTGGRRMTPLPRLVIIADEFAELKRDQPDFMGKLVSIARIGRSLGVHLILATQKPSGVVDDQTWSNARAKWCLRVQTVGDSQEMLKRPHAAFLTRAGRAYFLVGEDEAFEEIQTAYSGADYRPEASTPQSMKQLDALVKHICAVAADNGVAALAPIWLEPLPAVLPPWWVKPLPYQTTATQPDEKQGWNGQEWQPVHSWLQPIVGLQDDPYEREQSALPIDLGEGGHLAVYGVPASGKTTFLQTLITALARLHSPRELHMYLVDCNSQSLKHFEKLPHVGNVILEGDDECIDRLFRHLKQELARRKEILLNAGAGTSFVHYRNLARHSEGKYPELPAIVLICDGYPAFAEQYEGANDILSELAAEGKGVGIHLVLTANNPANIRARLSNNMRLAVTFELADKGDYSAVVGRTYGLEPQTLPGRGLVKRSSPLAPLEFQTMLPADGDTDPDRVEELRTLVAQMAEAWGEREKPQHIAVLPEVKALREFIMIEPGAASGTDRFTVPIGLRVVDLQPFTVNLVTDGPHFIITGESQSGKTTLLQTWLLALAARLSPAELQIYLCDFSQNDEGLAMLQTLPQTRGLPLIESDEALSPALQAIRQRLEERKAQMDEEKQAQGEQFDRLAFAAAQQPIILAIDDYIS